MVRKITTAASVAALVALGACGRADEAMYDSAAGATSGALATSPTAYPRTGLSVGATTGATTTTDTTSTKWP